MVNFQRSVHLGKRKLGRPCATQKFLGGDYRGTLLEVACILGIKKPLGTLGNAVPTLGNQNFFQKFEKFYFLFFRFWWSIVHQHHCPWPTYSPRAGSPLAFLILHFEPPSGGHLTKISVNGLQIEIPAKFAGFAVESRKTRVLSANGPCRYVPSVGPLLNTFKTVSYTHLTLPTICSV